MLAYLEISISDTFSWPLGRSYKLPSVLILSIPQFTCTYVHEHKNNHVQSNYAGILTNLCVDGVTNSLHVMEHLTLQLHLSL